MDKKLQFAKTQERLLEKIASIAKDPLNPKDVRESFAEWLNWFKTLKLPQLPDLKEERLYYRAFVYRADNFFAVQIWEMDEPNALTRCVKTLFANKFNIQSVADEIIDKRKLA